MASVGLYRTNYCTLDSSLIPNLWGSLLKTLIKMQPHEDIIQVCNPNSECKKKKHSLTCAVSGANHFVTKRCDFCKIDCFPQVFKSCLTPPENLVLADLQCLNLSPRCGDVTAYSRAGRCTVTSLLGVAQVQQSTRLSLVKLTNATYEVHVNFKLLSSMSVK